MAIKIARIYKTTEIVRMTPTILRGRRHRITYGNACFRRCVSWLAKRIANKAAIVAGEGLSIAPRLKKARLHLGIRQASKMGGLSNRRGS
jgi:hypothetical protein